MKNYEKWQISDFVTIGEIYRGFRGNAAVENGEFGKIVTLPKDKPINNSKEFVENTRATIECFGLTTALKNAKDVELKHNKKLQ